MPGGGVILDCAINARRIAVQTTSGIGMAFVTAAAWERAKTRGLHRSAETLQGLPLSEVVLRYLQGDPLWTGIALAVMNSLFIAKGEHEAGEKVPNLKMLFRLAETLDAKAWAIVKEMEFGEKCCSSNKKPNWTILWGARPIIALRPLDCK